MFGVRYILPVVGDVYLFVSSVFTVLFILVETNTKLSSIVFVSCAPSKGW